jgi:Raf kinase inhibitor-like YbhB/YbcL family protein
MEDPDAPGETWVHWVAWDISGTDLPEDVVNMPTEDPHAHLRQGTNSWQRVGYGGPCPPSGTHRYYFRVFALDRELDLDTETTRAGLLASMEGHVLDQGELMGTYGR